MSILDFAPGVERKGISRLRMATAGVFLGSLALEYAATLHTRRGLSTQPEIVAQEGDDARSIYVLPGCRSDGRFIARAMGEHLQDIGSVQGVAYPDKGFSVQDVGELLLRARKDEQRRHGERPASILAMSMGGMVVSKLLSDPTFRREFGDIDTMVFDSSPLDANDLTPHARRALFAANTLPSSYTVSQLYSRSVRRKAEKTSAEPSDVLFREHMRSTAATPLSAIAGQVAFIRDTQLDPEVLAVVGSEIGAAYYISAEEDGTTLIHQASQHATDLYGGYMLPVVDADRANPSHAASVEYPGRVAQLLGGHGGRVHELSLRQSQPALRSVAA